MVGGSGERRYVKKNQWQMLIHRIRPTQWLQDHNNIDLMVIQCKVGALEIVSVAVT